MHLVTWYEHLQGPPDYVNAPPEVHDHLETLYHYVARQLHALKILETRSRFVQTTLLFQLIRMQTDSDLSQLSEAITKLEEDTLSILHPELPRLHEERRQEKREALDEIRNSGPLKVTSLAPPRRTDQVVSAFQKVRDKALGKD